MNKHPLMKRKSPRESSGQSASEQETDRGNGRAVHMDSGPCLLLAVVRSNRGSHLAERQDAGVFDMAVNELGEP